MSEAGEHEGLGVHDPANGPPRFGFILRCPEDPGIDDGLVTPWDSETETRIGAGIDWILEYVSDCDDVPMAPATGLNAAPV